MEQGWTCGEQINDKYRQHPNLKSYKTLDRKVKASRPRASSSNGLLQDSAKLEDPIREALKSIEKLQFRLEKTDTGMGRIVTKPLQRKKQKDKALPDYIPKAMDFASVTMNREMQVNSWRYNAPCSIFHGRNCPKRWRATHMKSGRDK